MAKQLTKFGKAGNMEDQLLVWVHVLLIYDSAQKEFANFMNAGKEEFGSQKTGG